MIGETSGIEKHMIAEEALDTEYLIAKFGTTDEKLKKAVSATANALIGVFQGKAKADAKINVMLTGITLGEDWRSRGPRQPDNVRRSWKGDCDVDGEKFCGRGSAGFGSGRRYHTAASQPDRPLRGNKNLKQEVL